MLLHDTVRRVVQTGELPPRHELDALVDAGNDRARRTIARRRLWNNLQIIAAAARHGHTNHAQQRAQETILGITPYNREAALASARAELGGTTQ